MDLSLREKIEIIAGLDYVIDKEFNGKSIPVDTTSKLETIANDVVDIVKNEEEVCVSFIQLRDRFINDVLSKK